MGDNCFLYAVEQLGLVLTFLVTQASSNRPSGVWKVYVSFPNGRDQSSMISSEYRTVSTEPCITYLSGSCIADELKRMQFKLSSPTETSPLALYSGYWRLPTRECMREWFEYARDKPDNPTLAAYTSSMPDYKAKALLLGNTCDVNYPFLSDFECAMCPMMVNGGATFASVLVERVDVYTYHEVGKTDHLFQPLFVRSSYMFTTNAGTAHCRIEYTLKGLVHHFTLLETNKADSYFTDINALVAEMTTRFQGQFNKKVPFGVKFALRENPTHVDQSIDYSKLIARKETASIRGYLTKPLHGSVCTFISA